jgi:glycosyltransferase involved in cell wall biosynthesis
MHETSDDRPSICFVGLQNLPVLAPEYARPGIGGAERQQTLLARALAKQGFDVSMIVHDYGQQDGQVWDGITTYKAYGPREGVPVVRFVHPRWTSVWSAMKRADADIYYVSTAGMLIGEVAMFAKWHGRKAVYRVANNSDCDPLAKRIRYARDRVLYRYGMRNADLILAQTDTQESMLRENLGRESRVIPSLADAATPAEIARSERDIDVLWLTNIRPHKHADLLLDLARRMPNVTFHMVGGPVGGHEAHFADVEREANALPNVRFHGFVPYHETAPFYERARLFVSTSEMEGFPNTYLQAWARGTPVVAYFDPDSVIARNGLGAAVTTQDQLQATIARLLADDAAWQAASARCLAHSAARSDEKNMLEPYIDAFQGLRTAQRFG